MKKIRKYRTQAEFDKFVAEGFEESCLIKNEATGEVFVYTPGAQIQKCLHAKFDTSLCPMDTDDAYDEGGVLIPIINIEQYQVDTYAVASVEYSNTYKTMTLTGTNVRTNEPTTLVIDNEEGLVNSINGKPVSDNIEIGETNNGFKVGNAIFVYNYNDSANQIQATCIEYNDNMGYAKYLGNDGNIYETLYGGQTILNDKYFWVNSNGWPELNQTATIYIPPTQEKLIVEELIPWGCIMSNENHRYKVYDGPDYYELIDLDTEDNLYDYEYDYDSTKNFTSIELYQEKSIDITDVVSHILVGEDVIDLSNLYCEFIEGRKVYGYEFPREGRYDVYYQLVDNTTINMPDMFSYLEPIYGISIPDNIEHIGYCSFDYMPYLTSLKIGKNVKYIEPYALDDGNYNSGSFRMDKLYIESTEIPETFNLDICGGNYYCDVDLIVPKSQLDEYRNHPIWGKFNSIIGKKEPNPNPEYITATFDLGRNDEIVAESFYDEYDPNHPELVAPILGMLGKTATMTGNYRNYYYYEYKDEDENTFYALWTTMIEDPENDGGDPSGGYGSYGPSTTKYMVLPGVICTYDREEYDDYNGYYYGVYVGTDGNEYRYNGSGMYSANYDSGNTYSSMSGIYYYNEMLLPKNILSDIFTKIEVDGTEIDMNDDLDYNYGPYYYQFKSNGTHEVKYYLQDNTKVPEGMFFGYNNYIYLNSVELPNSIEEIGAYTFNYCYLNSITLPANVKKLYNYSLCAYDMSTIICKPINPPYALNNSFPDFCGTLLCVPTQSLDLYADTYPWYEFDCAGIIPDEPLVWNVTYHQYDYEDSNIMYYNKSMIQSMKINGVEHIGDITEYNYEPET